MASSTSGIYVVYSLYIVAPIVYFKFVFGPCFVMQYLVFYPVLQERDIERQGERERVGCFTLIVFLLSCDSKALFFTRGAVAWSFIVAFPGLTHLLPEETP